MKNTACACCGYKTFDEANERGSYDICPVCFWEDDGVQFEDPDYSGGANHVSLRQAQKNFIAFGDCRYDMIGNVRKPNANEVKDEDWKLVE